MNSIIPYPGGKSQVRHKLLSLVPSHSCWVEAFCGACWITFAKNPGMSDLEVVNDKDQGLINFWMTIREETEEFIAQSEFAVRSRAQFDRYKENQGRPRGPMPDVEAAWEYWYLIQNSFTGSVGYPRWKYAAQHKPVTRRSHHLDLIQMEPRIMEVYRRLQKVDIECLDFRDCIKRYDRPSTLFMLDPPYWSPKSGPQDYAVRFSQQDHEDLAEILCSIQGKFLLTYDDSLTVRNAYDWAYIKPHNFRYSVPHAGSAGESTIGQELIITNYDTAQVMGPLFAVQNLDIIV